MRSEYDRSLDAYYFSDRDTDSESRSVRQISLGMREVYVDIDHNGKILGVEVF